MPSLGINTTSIVSALGLEIQTLLHIHEQIKLRGKNENTYFLFREYFNQSWRASLVAQRVKPAVWETWVRFLVWEEPLEKEMATHSSILAWKIPWTEEPGGLQSMG